MRRTYHCPHCSRLLNPGESVVFIVEDGKERELILLSPELGDYSIVYPAPFSPVVGTLYTFRCPLCHADLTSKANHKLVELIAETEDDRTERVAFSRAYGERATFVSSGGDHVTLYGDHAIRYESPNFFGVSRDTEEA